MDKPYLAVDATGNIYATAPERGQILLVSPDGQTRALARPSGSGSRLGMPTGVEVGPRGDLFVAESSGGVVSRRVLQPER